VEGCETWYGMPSAHRGWPPDNMYESEEVYLRRLGLLTAEEEKMLAKAET
jgi:hypothetical protein